MLVLKIEFARDIVNYLSASAASELLHIRRWLPIH